MSQKRSITHQQMNNMNWRYKKKVPPTDEFASKNGKVKIIKRTIIPEDLPPKLAIALHGDNVVNYAVSKYTGSLPHPLKCSKCDYVAKSPKDSKEHWLDHD